MKCEQLALDIQTKRDPFTCSHLIRTAYDVHEGEVLCGYKGEGVYTNCHESVCGDPPNCAWEQPDNSEEAKARRLEWIQRIGRMNDGKATA